MAIGNFDKLVQGTPASWDVELRAQPDSRKASKQGLYTHKGMSLSEFFGTWKDRRAAKRRAGTEALKAQIDAQYQLPGLGDKVFRQAQAWTGRDFNLKVTTGDLAGLKTTADTLYQEHALREATGYILSPDFENDVLGPLSQVGTPQHPYDANPRAWDLHAGFIREEIRKLRTGGLESCKGSFKDLVTAIALGKGRTPLSPTNCQQQLRAHLDQPQVWAQMVRNANQDKLADFAAGSNETYVANLQACVDTWYQNKVAANAVGDITPDDVAWLKREYGRLAVPDDQPDPVDANDYHAGYDALCDSTEAMHQSFKADARAFMVSTGDFNARRKNAVAMIRDGRELSDRDIADWHAGFFSRAIDERKAWLAANTGRQARQREAALQGKFARLPQIKSFVAGPANRGLHDGLAAGKTDSVGGFMKTWIDATGMTGRLHQETADEGALTPLEESLFLLDEFADFEREVDALHAQHNNNLANAHPRAVQDLQDRARNIHARLEGLEEYSQRLYRTDDPNLERQTAACDALDDAAEHIRGAIDPYLNISEPHRARQNQAMLQQLPHIQALRNVQKGAHTFAQSDDRPSQVASRAALTALATMALSKRQTEALGALREACDVLDRYAGFVNEHGGRLVDLEARDFAGTLTKEDGQELSRLRSEVRALEKSIERFARRATALRRSLDLKARLAEPAAVLEALDATAALMLRRLRGRRAEAVDDDSEKSGSGGITGLMRSAQKHMRRNNVVNRGFLHGNVRPPVSKRDFARTGAMTLAIANSLQDPAFAERRDNLFRLSTMSLPRFDDMLSRRMVSDPLARRRDQRLAAASQEVANGLSELREVREDLQALRRQITDAAQPLPPVRFAGLAQPVPAESRREFYLKVIAEMEREIGLFEVQMAGRLGDYQEYLNVSRS